jgi:hypothetical protein
VTTPCNTFSGRVLPHGADYQGLAVWPPVRHPLREPSTIPTSIGGGAEPPKIRQMATSQLYYDCAMGLEVGEP